MILSILTASLFVYVPNTEAESITELIQEVKVIAEQKEALLGEISAFDQQKNFLEELSNKTKAEIEITQTEILKIEAELKVQEAYLSEDLNALYIEDQRSFFELILESRSFSDFVDRQEYLKIMRDDLTQTTDRISQLKKEAEQKRNILNQALAIQAVVKRGVEQQKTEKETSLSALLAEEKRIRDRFAERLGIAGKVTFCRGQGTVVKAKNPVFKFPVDCGYISQGFGMTEFASLDNAYNGALHNGVDVGVGPGTPVNSIGNGAIYAKGVTPSGGWGNWVMVKHDKVKIGQNDFEFYSLYAHLLTETHLKLGDRVGQDTLIGLVGGTPDWAPHLHFSLFLSSSGWSDGKAGAYPGNAIDPLNFMDIPISVSGTDWDPAYLHL